MDTADAAHPFSPTSDDFNKSDIILRSSDGVDFFAHKQILALTFHFFANMFAFPTPQGDAANAVRDGLPVVPLVESSTGVRVLLLMCYPRSATKHNLDSLDGVAEAHAAAAKYDLPDAKAHLESVLAEPRLIEQQTYRVYAIACLCGLEDIAKAAARQTLKLPVLGPASAYITSMPEYNILPARHLWLLEKLRRTCVDTIHEYLDEYRTCICDEDGHDNDGDSAEFNHLVAIWWKSNFNNNLKGTKLEHAPSCGPHGESHAASGYYFLSPAAWFVKHITRVIDQTLLSSDIDDVARRLAHVSRETVEGIAACPLCIAEAPNDLSLLAINLRRNFNAVQNAELAKITFTSLQ